MTAPETHPSFLQLDRRALGVVDPAIGLHVAACERCRTYVERVSTIPVVPRWASDLAVAPGAAARPPRYTWHALLAALAGTAALLVLFVQRGPTPNGGGEVNDNSYIGAKGLPAVWVYRKRGDDVVLWDGQEPFAPGDDIRLKVDPDGFAHVGVFARGADGHASRLYGAPATGNRAALLPVAWSVDDSPGTESLIVILSDKPIDASEVERFLQREDPRRFWLRRLELPKTGARGTR